MFASLLALALLAPLASALTITYPGSAGGWLGNTTNTVRWTWNQDDPTFSMELNNVNYPNGPLGEGPIALANNVNPNLNSLDVPLPDLPAGPGYILSFVAIDNINKVYANSTTFTISANLGSSTLSLSTYPTSPAGSKTSSTHTGTNTRVTTTTTSTGTTSSSGTGTPTSTSSFTFLTTTTISPSPTSSKGGAGPAARMEMAWYFGAVGALLGAILV